MKKLSRHYSQGGNHLLKVWKVLTAKMKNLKETGQQIKILHKVMLKRPTQGEGVYFHHCLCPEDMLIEGNHLPAVHPEVAVPLQVGEAVHPV